MKDNKLIAEFMEMTYYIPNDDSLMVEKAPIGVLVTPTKSLEYHTSWDWLIPVIKKCRTTEVDKNREIGKQRLIDNINFTFFTLDLLGTYNNIIEFME